jgi:hypothetical protein
LSTQELGEVADVTLETDEQVTHVPLAPVPALL